MYEREIVWERKREGEIETWNNDRAIILTTPSNSVCAFESLQNYAEESYL